MVEVNSETDFVARNEQFQGLVQMIADIALDSRDRRREDQGRARSAASPSNDAINSRDRDHRREHDAAPRRRAAGRQGAVGSYVHNSVGRRARQDRRHRRRSRSPGQADELAALGRQVAMHVAASNPQAVDPAGLDPQVVAREKDILADKFRAAGQARGDDRQDRRIRPQDLLQGGLPARSALHPRRPTRPSPRRSRRPKARSAAPIKVTGFVRYALGEGIDRPEGDFAAEVAAAAGQLTRSRARPRRGRPIGETDRGMAVPNIPPRHRQAVRRGARGP